MLKIEKDAIVAHFTQTLYVKAHYESGLGLYDEYEAATARFAQSMLEQIFPALQFIAVSGNRQTGLWDVDNKGEIANFRTLTQALEHVTAILRQLMEDEAA